MDVFEDIFGSSDSEEEEFLGFESDEFEERNGEDLNERSSESEDEFGEIPQLNDLNWVQTATQVEEPEFFPFVGPKNRPPNDSELGYFELFFAPTVMQLILEQTNLYAEQENANKAKKDPDWFEADGQAKNLSLEEFKAFLGVLILMGIVRLPSVRDYWNEEDPFMFQPSIAKVFPRNRFLAILRYIHLNDNSELPPREDPKFKLYRVQPLVDQLQSAFSQVFINYFPQSRHLSIDEAMIKYKGRLSFIQYMPMKPVKRGIKVYCLCEATSGYLVNFVVYVGRSADGAQNSTTNTVLSLLHNFSGRNYYVFMDNWFSSIELFLQLQRLQIRACGTLRINRKGFPPCLKNVKLQAQGNSSFAQCGNLVVQRWRDKAKNNPVTVLSTMYNVEGNDKVKRRRKGPDGRMMEIEISRPPSITEYCKYMGGVDLSDQNRSYYPVSTRRNVKWWKYVYYFLLDVCIVNSWVLMKAVTGQNRAHVEFRKFLAKQLIGQYSARKRIGRPRIHPVVAEISHQYIELLPGQRKKQCRNCQRKRRADLLAQREAKRPRESRFGCDRCDVVLCKGQCWLEWHSQPATS